MTDTTQIADKTLIMIVGPTSMGKTTLMAAAAELDPEFSYVISFTTRTARAGEDTYRFITRTEASELRDSGQAITFVNHPTTGDYYGTTIESYTTPYNLLDALSGTVAQYRGLGFKSTVTISLYAEVAEWKAWFLKRYPEPTLEAQKRLDEARSSLAWSLRDSETCWLFNHGDPTDVARRLIEIARGGPRDNGVEKAKALLEFIKTGTIWS